MGACEFYTTAAGKTAREAFDRAVRVAQYEHGHAGYTGTIAEKRDFVMVETTKAKLLTRLDEAIKAEQAREARDGRELGIARHMKKARAVLEAKAEPLSPADVARALIDADDPRICDKWGPAGCVATGEGRWLFFGFASE